MRGAIVSQKLVPVRPRMPNGLRYKYDLQLSRLDHPLRIINVCIYIRIMFVSTNL